MINNSRKQYSRSKEIRTNQQEGVIETYLDWIAVADTKEMERIFEVLNFTAILDPDQHSKIHDVAVNRLLKLMNESKRGSSS